MAKKINKLIILMEQPWVWDGEQHNFYWTQVT